MSVYSAALLLVVFGVSLAAFDLILLGLTPALLSRLARVAPATRAHAILLARSLPLGLAVSAVALIFLPAWWRHEPDNSGETASWFLLTAALLSILPVLQGLYRALRMFLRTRDRLLVWRGRGRSNAALTSSFEVVEVKSDDLALCVGGYLRPTIFASADVMRSLDPSEFEAALAHEVSHAKSRDPLRLLWMGSCPDFLQWFSLDAPWRRAFARACEFAADARAAGGDQAIALDLASALLKVARLRTCRPLIGDAALDVAVSSAYSSPVDLRARVEALANQNEACVASGPRPGMAALTILAIAGAGVALSPRAHALTEALGRLLAP